MLGWGIPNQPNDSEANGNPQTAGFRIKSRRDSLSRKPRRIMEPSGIASEAFGKRFLRIPTESGYIPFRKGNYIEAAVFALRLTNVEAVCATQRSTSKDAT